MAKNKSVEYKLNQDGSTNLDKFKGIYLDVGCGENKQKGFVGLDIRPLPGVDIVWDMEKTPYPIEPDTCLSILASHVVEHINPARFGFVNVMNEWWRIMKPFGRLMIVVPYAGSYGYWQDPTHCNPCNEATFAYFDPVNPSGLYTVYYPKPWRIVKNAWHINGTLEVIMMKMPSEDVKVENMVVTVDKKWIPIKTEVINK